MGHICQKGLCILFLSYFACAYATTDPAVSPIPPPPLTLPQVSALGKQLFHDPLFSNDHSLSCATCHNLQEGGVDRLPVSKGAFQKSGLFNTLTVWNAALNFYYFWDARANSLEEVLNDHVSDPTVLANTWEIITERVQKNQAYSKAFQTLYKAPPSPANIKKVLIHYLETLVTPLSPFDRYLLGNSLALSPEAQKGYELFKQYGCITCHQGHNLGGNLLQPLGIYKNYFISSSTTAADLGHYRATGNKKDLFVFRVPSLRNVALTAPYFHDGSIGNLKDVILVMGLYQAGRHIPPQDVDSIVHFLNALTAPLPLNDPD